jgi:hypothetical protein
MTCQRPVNLCLTIISGFLALHSGDSGMVALATGKSSQRPSRIVVLQGGGRDGPRATGLCHVGPWTAEPSDVPPVVTGPGVVDRAGDGRPPYRLKQRMTDAARPAIISVPPVS